MSSERAVAHTVGISIMGKRGRVNRSPWAGQAALTTINLVNCNYILLVDICVNISRCTGDEQVYYLVGPSRFGGSVPFPLNDQHVILIGIKTQQHNPIQQPPKNTFFAPAVHEKDPKPDRFTERKKYICRPQIMSSSTVDPNAISHNTYTTALNTLTLP